MKRLLLPLLCALAVLPRPSHGDVLRTEPALIEHSERWFRYTNPVRFFAKEKRHGRIFFIGIYDPAAGDDSPAPGVSRRDPAFRVSRTVFVLRGNSLNPDKNRRYEASAREFARRYNPLVLAYLKQHPAEK